MNSFLKYILLLFFLFILRLFSQEYNYPWLSEPFSSEESIENSIKVLDKFQRVSVQSDSFAQWLRSLPLKKGASKVHLFNGKLKENQQAHYSVLDIDIGSGNLQQCADAIMRLRAEYLYSKKKFQSIHFNFTSGDRCEYSKWIEGVRPVIKSNIVSWKNLADKDTTYQNFRKYLNTVFTYAGSYSLKNELKRVIHINNIKIGDIFIQGGFPGHAVMVVDMAKNVKSGETAILLIQSYMPAQEIHILKNQNDLRTNPWYIVGANAQLETPEWVFEWDDLYQFEE